MGATGESPTRDRTRILILPGVPGMPDLRVDERVPYPDTTIDIAKSLRNAGYDVEFTEERDDRRYVGHKAYDVWIPILLLAREILVGVEAGLLVELLKGCFRGHPPEAGVLHVDWRVRTREGDEERIIADGRADEVMEALDAFERRLRDR